MDEANKILEKKLKEIKNRERVFAIINIIKKNHMFYNKYYGMQSTYFEKYIINPILGSFALCNQDFVAVGNIHDISD